MDAATSGEVVSKGQLAARRNVSPGRVSQWISEGKIKPDALVGEGRNAKINVAVATRQLRDSLDVGQLTGNGVGTRLDLPLPAPALPAAPTREPAPSLPGDPIADAIKQERLDQLRRANRREAEEEAARSGKYTDAAEAARQMVVIATKMMAVMEGSLTELATAVSVRFEIPQRDVLYLLRSEFRKVRASAAKTFRDMATDLPPVVFRASRHRLGRPFAHVCLAPNSGARVDVAGPPLWGRKQRLDRTRFEGNAPSLNAAGWPECRA